MINSDLYNHGLGNKGTGVPINHKEPHATMKKTALRDVQNENRSLMRNREVSPPFIEGRPVTDAIQVHGTNKRTPEGPLSTPCHLSLSNNGESEHVVNARRRFELELGRGRIQDNMGKYANCLQFRYGHLQQEISLRQSQMRENNINHVPVVTTNHMAPVITFSYGGPSVPNSSGKPGNALQAAESDCPKVTSDVPHSIDSKGADDQHRTERFSRLQKFLKQCDESNQQDYIQMLLHLSPAELSRHAVELEKRAIQLTIEEGKEMHRVKALNVLGKSGPTNSPLQMTQKLQSKK